MSKEREYISFSAIKWFKSPYSLFNKDEVEQTADQAYGEALHKYILEPDDFYNYYHVLTQKLDLRRSEDKKLMQDITKDKKIVYSEDIYVFQHMLKQVKENYLKFYNDIHTTEEMFYDNDKMIRGIIDALTDYCIIDLKTTKSLRSFEKDIRYYEYYIQAAMYQDLIIYNKGKKLDYYILAIDKETPFECAMFKLSDQLIDQGRDIYNYRLKLIREDKDMQFCEIAGGRNKIINVE